MPTRAERDRIAVEQYRTETDGLRRDCAGALERRDLKRFFRLKRTLLRRGCDVDAERRAAERVAAIRARGLVPLAEAAESLAVKPAELQAQLEADMMPGHRDPETGHWWVSTGAVDRACEEPRSSEVRASVAAA